MSQQEFWRGEFGDQYIERNKSPNLMAANISLFANIMARSQILPKSILEIGANIGLNLKALSSLLPNCELTGLEINTKAAQELRSSGFNTIESSIEGAALDSSFDLVLTKGVLIHINPEALKTVYEKIFHASNKWILLIEYYSPSPVHINYRGHENKLFKRDFAGEFLDHFPGRLNLVNYGFNYHRGNFPQDDLTWFLLEKRSHD